MEVINKKAHINKDGMLNIAIPTQLAERDVELVVIINPLENSYEKNNLSKDEILMLEERWEEYQRNPNNVKTWEEIKAAIRKKYEL